MTADDEIMDLTAQGPDDEASVFMIDPEVASAIDLDAAADRAEARMDRILAEQASDLGALWKSAAAGEMRGLERMEPGKRAPQAKSPRWATPIEALDMATNGGIYGLTGLRGSAKSGKSMFALLLALLAAVRDELTVVYVAAEMTRDQILGRLGWLAHEHGISPQQLDEALGERLYVFHSRGAFTWEDFTEFVASSLYGNTTALVVIDSINTLLADMDGGGDYWTRYRSVLRTILGVRKRTEGAFAALVLSEHNKAKASKGEQLEYAADLMLDFQQTKMPRVVKISVVGTRELGSDGPLGEFRMTPFATYQQVRGEA